MLTKKEYYVMGDGNCGPRAIIQNLLLEGLGYPEHKQFICKFLRDLYRRNKDNTAPYEQNVRHLSQTVVVDIFGRSDPRPSSNMNVDSLYRLPVREKDILEQQLLGFINTYEGMSTTEVNLTLLTEKLIPKTRGVQPTHDHLIYLLAAYLRFDIQTETSTKNPDNLIIQKFYNDILPVLRHGETLTVEEIIAANGTLERSTHAAFIACYLANHNIGYSLKDKDSDIELYNNKIYFTSKQPKLSIINLTTGQHFSVQWSKPNLFNIQLLDGFLIAFGIAAIAIALTVLSLNVGIIIASIGVVSLSIGGYGFFKRSDPSSFTQPLVDIARFLQLN